MLGQSALVNPSGLSANNRVFVYEVEGLRQSDQTDNNSYPVRQSGTIAIKVPYNRMNEEMRRITRMGGKIVAIHSLADYAARSQATGE
jgi:hypothetical protein